MTCDVDPSHISLSQRRETTHQEATLRHFDIYFSSLIGITLVVNGF